MEKKTKKAPNGTIILVSASLEDEASRIGEFDASGYELMVCKEPPKAVNILDGKPSWFRPVLIVVDMTLPQMSGYELLRRLQDKYFSKKIPMIMLTKQKSAEDELEATNAGAIGCMPKPFALETVHEIVEREKARRARNEGAAGTGFMP